MSDKSKRRIITGTVVSDKMNKTVSVAVVSKVQHPVYRKYVKRTIKVMAHNENNEAKTGDVVTIKEVRPLSKNKRWMVTGIVRKGTVKIDLINDGSEKNDTADDKA